MTLACTAEWPWGRRGTSVNVEGAVLVLGAEGDQLFFWHEGHGDPEPLDDGPLHVCWVLLPGREGVPRQRVVFCGDDLGLEIERVEIDTSRADSSVSGVLAALASAGVDGRPQIFRPGTVKARWQAKRRVGWRTAHGQQMLA